MSQYVVKSSLDHNGKNYAPNSLVTLDDEEAKVLLSDGVVAVLVQAEEPAAEVAPEEPVEEAPVAAEVQPAEEPAAPVQVKTEGK